VTTVGGNMLNKTLK